MSMRGPGQPTIALLSNASTLTGAQETLVRRLVVRILLRPGPFSPVKAGELLLARSNGQSVERIMAGKYELAVNANLATIVTAVAAELDMSHRLRITGPDLAVQRVATSIQGGVIFIGDGSRDVDESWVMRLQRCTSWELPLYVRPVFSGLAPQLLLDDCNLWLHDWLPLVNILWYPYVSPRSAIANPTSAFADTYGYRHATY